jgi:hypothetical protein
MLHCLDYDTRFAALRVKRLAPLPAEPQSKRLRHSISFRLVTGRVVEMGSEESIEVQAEERGYHISRGGTCNRSAEPAWGWN